MNSMECEDLLIADRVIREDNGKISVIGIFKNINIPIFPAVIAPWFVYAHIKDLPKTGQLSITITIYNTENTFVLFSQTIDVPEGKRKGDDIDINLQIANVAFQKPGKHAVSVNINGNTTRIAYFNVTQTGGVAK